jgi:hypothetical protein
MDDGSLTPRPCPQEGIWRYDNWLSFCETIIAAGPEGESEMLLVIRRNIHEDFHFNETTAPEDLFYFDVHKNYRSRFYPTTLRLYHQDADNRVTTEYSSGVGRLRAEAESDELIRLLEKHGQALAQTAPRAYAWYLASMGASAFRCGRKLQGSAACLRALYRQPLQPRVMGMMIAGVLGSPAFEAIRASHRRRPA